MVMDLSAEITRIEKKVNREGGDIQTLLVKSIKERVGVLDQEVERESREATLDEKIEKTFLGFAVKILEKSNGRRDLLGASFLEEMGPLVEGASIDTLRSLYNAIGALSRNRIEGSLEIQAQWRGLMAEVVARRFLLDDSINPLKDLFRGERLDVEGKVDYVLMPNPSESDLDLGVNYRIAGVQVKCDEKFIFENLFEPRDGFDEKKLKELIERKKLKPELMEDACTKHVAKLLSKELGVDGVEGHSFNVSMTPNEEQNYTKEHRSKGIVLVEYIDDKGNVEYFKVKIDVYYFGVPIQPFNTENDSDSHLFSVADGADLKPRVHQIKNMKDIIKSRFK